MRPISIKLSAPLDQKLTAIARRRHTNRSTVMREALETYVAGRPGRASVTAAAGDLVGSLHGPEDLATAARHLAGYGK